MLRVTPDLVLSRMRCYLSVYELKEIKQFADIYYLGVTVKNKVVASKAHEFDDKSGNYVFIHFDHLFYRYQIISLLGTGCSSQVVKVYDYLKDSYAAIKILKQASKVPTDAENELMILQILMNQNNDYIVQMYESFYFRNHLCIAFEYLPMNTYQLLSVDSVSTGLPLAVMQSIVECIIRGLYEMNKLDLIHGDLKPDNIGVVDDWTLKAKLLDFNMSFPALCAQPTNVIQTKWYRAPEVILRGKLTKAVDMWSVGCMIYEYYTGFVLFRGKGEADQLYAIVEMLGSPSERFLQQFPKVIVNKYFAYGNVPRYCNLEMGYDGNFFLGGGSSGEGTRGAPNSRNIYSELEDCMNPSLVNFIIKCLVWEPKLRLTPLQALNHPFLANIIPLTYADRRFISLVKSQIARNSCNEEENAKVDTRPCTIDCHTENKKCYESKISECWF